jgi:hypothetical protein
MNQPYVRRRFGDVLARREAVQQREPASAFPEISPLSLVPPTEEKAVLEQDAVDEPSKSSISDTDTFEVEDIPAPPSAAPSSGAPPIYHGGLRLHSQGKTSRTGMSVKVEMLDLAFTDINPFKKMYRGRENGLRCRVWFARQEDVDATDDLSTVPEIYKGEAVLLGYQDDHTGTTVLFLLNDGPDGAGRINPFDDYHAAPKDGERLFGAFWALSDQETLQHPAYVRRSKTPFHAMSPTKQANILCRNPRFISFLKAHEAYYLDGGFSEIDVHDDGPAFAADVLRRHLGIASRSELKAETVVAERARTRWERVMEEFDRNRHGGAWQEV